MSARGERSRSGGDTSADTAARPFRLRLESCRARNRRRRRPNRVWAERKATRTETTASRRRETFVGNLCPPVFVCKDDEKKRVGESHERVSKPRRFRPAAAPRGSAGGRGAAGRFAADGDRRAQVARPRGVPVLLPG